MFYFARGETPRQTSELFAYLCGANGQNCRTDTLSELAAWFRGMATYARRTRG